MLNMNRLSVNINKVATLRNARGQNTPNLIKVAKDIERFGAMVLQFIHVQMNVIFGIQMLRA